MTTHDNNWYWSQGGATLGPVDLQEINRLVAANSITRETWLFDPAQGAWVAAESVAGLFLAAGSAGAAAAVPPCAPPDSAQTTASSLVYCRSCGASNDQSAVRCVSCGSAVSVSGGIDPKVAAIVCRASVLATPMLLAIPIIGPFIGPTIVWVIGAKDPRVVAEAKETMNCLITLAIVFVAVWLFGALGLILIFPTALAAIATAAMAIYCVVVGILGLIAAADGKPYRYPGILRLIK